MSTEPTGGREEREATGFLVLTRTFRAPMRDVWSALTEPGRMERWIGTWAGDPTSGTVDFRMTAEGADAPVEVIEIDECAPPSRLATRHRIPGNDFVWHLELDLVEREGVTTLTFAQKMSDPEIAENVGPGWEYYLDRLVALMTDTAVTNVVWDDYYPAQSDYYRALFARAT